MARQILSSKVVVDGGNKNQIGLFHFLSGARAAPEVDTFSDSRTGFQLKISTVPYRFRTFTMKFSNAKQQRPVALISVMVGCARVYGFRSCCQILNYPETCHPNSAHPCMSVSHTHAHVAGHPAGGKLPHVVF